MDQESKAVAYVILSYTMEYDYSMEIILAIAIYQRDFYIFCEAKTIILFYQFQINARGVF